MFDRTYVETTLKTSVCTAVFTKADGTRREMRCTLIDTYLPENYQGKGMILNETDRNSVSVWDIDNGGWRAFRLDTLIEFRPELVGAKVMLFE